MHNTISLPLQGTPSLRPKCSVETEKPRVLFTGIVYQEGEQIVKDLGGQLVESVYECTHLVTDKVSAYMVWEIWLMCVWAGDILITVHQCRGHTYVSAPV